MMNKKETAPVLAHKEAAGETLTFGKVGVSEHQYITKNGGPQVRIAEFLHRGQKNAISRRELESILNMDGREVRKKIEIERRQGVPILSDCRYGYFLAESPEEVTAFVRSMRHRAQGIMATALSIESAGGCF